MNGCEPSPEATLAIEEARAARAAAEARLPLAVALSDDVREQIDTNHFLDLIESIAARHIGGWPHLLHG